MAAAPVPKYSIQFSFAHSSTSDPMKFELSNQRLTPSDAALSPIVLAILQSFAMDYMNNVGTQIKSPSKARFSFSIEKGAQVVSCNDRRIAKVFSGQMPGVAVLKANADPLSTIAATIEPTELMKQQAKAHFKEKEVVFFNPHSLTLLKAGLNDPFEVDLEITKREVLSAGSLTTSTLRFPHLLKHLALHHKKGNSNEELNICIIGPGLLEDKKTIPSSPQFVEIFSLFPNAKFSLLENDQRALTVMKQQFHTCKFAAYDPFMLRARTLREFPGYVADQSYQSLFNSMKQSLSKNALSPNPAEAQKMLAGEGLCKRLVVQVDPEKIEVREFDINTSQFKDEEQGKFDIIVGTMSLFLALGEQMETNHVCTPLPILGKFIKALKEKGTLYIDKAVFERFFEEPYSKELAMKHLETFVGHRLILEEIPLSDFQADLQGTQGVIESMTIGTVRKRLQSNKEEETSGSDITSSSIIAITRTEAKVERTADDLALLQTLTLREDQKQD